MCDRSGSDQEKTVSKKRTRFAGSLAESSLPNRYGDHPFYGSTLTNSMQALQCMQCANRVRQPRTVGFRGASVSYGMSLMQIGILLKPKALFSVILIVGLFASCTPSDPTSQAGPPFRPVGTVEDVMHDVVYPHAEVVWDSVGTIITVEGTNEIRPSNEDEWMRVMQSAFTLAEAGNLLMMEGRARDTADWMTYAVGLIDASMQVMEAAENRDDQGVFDTGGELYAACTACHEQYWEKPPSAMRP